MTLAVHHCELSSSSTQYHMEGRASKRRRLIGAKTTVLIGPTGHGKSTCTLGNFLLNPEEKYQKKALQSFAVATSNRPPTTVVEVKSDRMDHPTLYVIDTPGLNESATEDLRHVIDIVKALKHAVGGVHSMRQV